MKLLSTYQLATRKWTF